MLIRPLLNKTLYELRKKKPNIGYCNIFGTKCFIIKMSERDGKLGSKSYEVTFLGYSLTGHAYRVYNIYIKMLLKSLLMSHFKSLMMIYQGKRKTLQVLVLAASWQ